MYSQTHVLGLKGFQREIQIGQVRLIVAVYFVAEVWVVVWEHCSRSHWNWGGRIGVSILPPNRSLLSSNSSVVVSWNCVAR